MRIVIASPVEAARSALRLLVQVQPDMELAGEAADMMQLLCQVKENKPDLVILDWDVFGDRHSELVELFELFHTPPQVLGLSTRAENRQAVLSAGALAFACKEESPERLLKAIRDAGRSWLPKPNAITLREEGGAATPSLD